MQFCWHLVSILIIPGQRHIQPNPLEICCHIDNVDTRFFFLFKISFPLLFRDVLSTRLKNEIALFCLMNTNTKTRVNGENYGWLHYAIWFNDRMMKHWLNSLKLFTSFLFDFDCFRRQITWVRGEKELCFNWIYSVLCAPTQTHTYIYTPLEQ